MIYYIHNKNIYERGDYNMSLTEMKKLYVDEAHKAGFYSDEEVVAAWCKDPIKWAKLFSIRI